MGTEDSAVARLLAREDEMEKGDAIACFGKPNYIGEKSVRMLGGHEEWEVIPALRN